MTPHLLHRAQQTRSLETQERWITAGLELLERMPWDDVSIAALATEAGLSVGGFYARFRSKEAFLMVLHERYEEKRTEHFLGFFETDVWDRPLAERVTALVELVVDWMQTHRGVLRTFLLRFWAHPKELGVGFERELGNLYQQAARLLVGDRNEVRRPDPDGAARMALAVLGATSREVVVMKPAPNPGALTRDLKAFKSDMADLIHQYLGSEDGSPNEGG